MKAKVKSTGEVVEIIDHPNCTEEVEVLVDGHLFQYMPLSDLQIIKELPKNRIIINSLITKKIYRMKPSNKKVVRPDNLPSKLPFFQTLSTILALDYLNAPQWLCGAIGFLFLIMWIGSISQIINNKKVDLFPEDNNTDNQQ